MRKNINKTILLALFMICIMATLAGCKSNVAFTYTVNTGDTVTIECDVSDGLGFTPALPFTVSEGKKQLAQGNFISLEGYNEYISILGNAGDAATIYQEETVKDNLTYIFYTTKGESGIEHNYIIKINDSKTALVLGSVGSKEAAEKAFNALKFSIVK
jgi:hypothetical protein